VGSACRQWRCERFVKEFGELALKEYGLPAGIAASQNIDIHPCFEMAFIYVTLTFPSGSYPMMMDKIIFDPELDDRDLVEQIYQDYENSGLSREEVITRLKRADLIQQDYKEADNG